MLWQLDEINSAGLLNKFTLGDANATTLSYTPERLLNVKSTLGVQVYGFDFDAQNGNLLKRQLSIGNNVKEEVFAYDNLERLEQHRFDEIPPLAVTPSPLNISYDPQGKILSKTDAGLDYRYNMNDQLKKIQQHQAAISLNEQNITYTPFRTVNSIEENGIELTYSYGPDQSRYKGIWKNNGTQYRKRINASGYEINEETVNGVTTTQAISYVSSPNGLCAMYVEENGSGTFYFVHTDHLGSITAVTNANGNVIARQNFDAWGRRRKVQDYSHLPQNTSSTDNGLNNNSTLPKWLYRGYIGHEMLDEFALINMNSRLYDPVLGMMLSPDNYIQAPGNTQNYNRYSYCLNNPLKYTDPSGNVFIADDIAAGLIGMGINLISQGVAGNITSWQSCLGYSSVGFASGIAGYYGTPFAGGAVAGAGNSFVSQMEANGWEWSSMSDVNYKQVAYSGGIGGLSGIVGYGAGQWAGNHLGGIALNGLHISANSAIGGAITGSIGGTVGGYAGGFTGGLIMTGDFGAAHQSGLSEAIFGFGIGAGQSAIGGYVSAKKAGLNPLTGKPKNSIVIGEGMTTDPIKGWMGVDKIAKDLGSDFYKPDSKIQPKVDGYGTTSELMYDNGVWIEIKIQQQVTIYDRGPVGNNSQYYNMEVGRTMDYPNVWKVKAHYNQTQTIRILIINK